MKHIKLASAAAIALGLAIAGSASAQTAGGGTIQFNGSIGDATCTIGGGTGTSGGANFTVTLEQANVGDFTAAAQTAQPKDFNIQVGKPGEATCAAGTVARVSFDSHLGSVNAAGRLSNDTTVANGGASGVDLQVLDAKGPIDFNLGYTGSDYTVGANNTISIPFSVQYYSTAAAVSAGGVNSKLIYTVAYN